MLNAKYFLRQTVLNSQRQVKVFQMAVISQGNVTRMMSMIIEEVVTPDQGILSGQIRDLFQENQEISSIQNLTDTILDGVSQEFTVKEDIVKPVKNTKLAGSINNFFIDKIKNEKLRKLLKTYN